MRLGAQNVVTTTRGTLYFDNFESRRFSYIGTLPPPDLPQPQLPSEPGWTATNYTYSTAHAHAVTAAGSNSYSYDANGNMTCRMESGGWFVQSYNAENRLSSVTQLASVLQMWNGACPSPATFAAKWDFAYDGDGTRVTQLYTPYDSNGNPQTPVLTVYFMGGAYEMTSNTIRKYYAIAGMTIAMNDGSGLKYLLTDHLGSVVGITDSSGTLISQQRYLPFGQVRTDVGSITQTDLSYTGQRALNMGLMDYKARMYDAALGRFLSADTIVPNSLNPQAFNRYAYANNNPIRYNDPTGHDASDNYKLRKLKHNYGRYWNDVKSAWHREGDQALVEWSNRIAAEQASAAASQAATPAADNYCIENPWDCNGSYSYPGGDGSGSATQNVEGPLTSFMLGLPGTSDQWATVATGFDVAAWLIDLYDAGVVTAGGIMGAGIPAAFLPEGVPEVPVVTGLAGMAIAELYVQPPMQVANGLSLISTSLTVVADTKAGTTRIEQGVIGTKVLNSATTTGYGFAVPEAYLALIIQSVAVANDLHWTSFPFPSGSK